MNKNLRLSAVALMGLVFAASGDSLLAPPVFTGYSSFEAGQVVKGFDVDGNKEHAWIEKGFIGLGVDKAIGDRLHIIVEGEGALTFSYRVDKGFVESFRETQVPRTTFNIKRGEGILTLGNADALQWQFELGFFPCKYNPDVRNLGEYLFRSTPYPQFIVNVFDRTNADLLGARAGGALWKKINWDVMFTSERQIYPLEDFSLSLLLRYRPIEAVDVGLGCKFDRLFPVSDDLTTPENSRSNQFVTADGDTGYFSYPGTILMGRASLDPKQFLPFRNVFGQADLRLYAEAAVLGTRDYNPVDSSQNYYSKLTERIPFMLGFNIPAFRLLDVASFELEYFNNRYPNSIAIAFEDGNPLPSPDFDLAKHDKLKWSAYIKRSIGGHFSIMGQVARDHLIPLTHSYARAKQDRTDVLLRSGDWWWSLKTQFTF